MKDNPKSKNITKNTETVSYNNGKLTSYTINNLISNDNYDIKLYTVNSMGFENPSHHQGTNPKLLVDRFLE